MDNSEEDWSLHDIDRVQEEDPPSPRGFQRLRLGSSGMIDTNETSSSSLRHHASISSGASVEGRGRRRLRTWGSIAGNIGSDNASPEIPPSLNLEAVMSFPPMSDEQVADERPHHHRRRRSSSSSSRHRSSDHRRHRSTASFSPKTTRRALSAAQMLYHQGTSHSLPGTGSFGGLLDESISEHVGGEGELLAEEAEFAEQEDNDDDLGSDPPMPFPKQPSKSNLRHSSRNQSVTSGLTAQQRARFDEDHSSASSRMNRSRVYIYEASMTSSERPPESRRRAGSVEIASDSSWIDDTEHGGEELTEAGDSTVETKKRIVMWGGIELPQWLVSWFPSLHRISTVVVTRAPCFIWWGFRQPTDRSILARLNILISLVTTLQVCVAIFLASVSWKNPDKHSIDTLTDEEAAAQDERGTVLFNVWSVNVYIYLTGIIAFVNLASALLTIRVIRNVNLVGAIRYLWLLLWLLPWLFQVNIGLYDYFRVTDVWIKHYWRDPSMSWFRGRFCTPSSSADTLCTVPYAADNTTEKEWCLENYNSTDCSSIRNDAQSDMETWILSFYYVNASIGLVLICLVVLAVNTLEHIISKPLVQKSRESNVPAWMSLPIVSCIVFGSVFAFSESSVLNSRTQSEATWISPLFLVTGALFFLAAIIGWFISAKPVMSTRHKRNKLISIWAFIISMSIIIALLITIFSTCIAFSVSLVEVPISSSQRGDIACFLENSGSCTRCEEETNRCPEWTTEDVTKIIQTQAKASASLAAMLMLYAFSALRFGIGLRTHIRMYQIEYV